MRKLLRASVLALAVRLLRGETIEFTDEHGRFWQGDARRLLLVLPGNTPPLGAVVDGDAYDVAARLADLSSHAIPSPPASKAHPKPSCASTYVHPLRADRWQPSASAT